MLKQTRNIFGLTENNRLLFYFAGHGKTKTSNSGPSGYLIPQDARLGKYNTYLEMQELVELKCNHLLVILDCCFAGTFRWTGSRNVIVEPDTVYQEHYDRFISSPAWKVLTSAAHNQEAADSSLTTDERGQAQNSKHSPFADALIKGLRGEADLYPDNVITLQELYAYLQSSLKDPNQIPGSWSLKQEYDKGEYVFPLS